MKNKNLIIGLGVLAVAGIGYYMWKKKSEKKSGACGCSGADGEDDYSNAKAGGNTTTTHCDCKSGIKYTVTKDSTGATINTSWLKDNSGTLVTCTCSKALVRGGTSSLANTGYSNAQAGGNTTTTHCDCKSGIQYTITKDSTGAIINQAWKEDNSGKLLTCTCSKELVRGGTRSLANTGYSNAQAGTSSGNKCDCFNGILTNAFGQTLKDKDGKNIPCECKSSKEFVRGGTYGTLTR